MSWKKGCLFTSIGALALIAVAVFWLYNLTGKPTQSAEEFLTLIGQGRVDEAYMSTSPVFQAQYGEDQFIELVEAVGLMGYQSVSWTDKGVRGGHSILKGVVENSQGKTVEIELALAEVGSGWKVMDMTGPAIQALKKKQPREKEEKVAVSKEKEEVGIVHGGAETEESLSSSLPGDDEIDHLATQTLLAFNNAVKNKDFTSFYQVVSKVLQAQTTPEKLKKAFQAFIDTKAQMDGLADVMPRFEPEPSIDGNGLLVMSGHFPTQPYQVHFELKYILEEGEWKLIGINVNLKQP